MTNKQTILIAGATGNIGGGAAVVLAKRGARVVLLGRRLERLEAKADFIRVTLSEEGIDYQSADITEGDSFYEPSLANTGNPCVSTAKKQLKRHLGKRGNGIHLIRNLISWHVAYL